MSTIQLGSYSLTAIRQQLKPASEITAFTPSGTAATAESRAFLKGLDSAAQKNSSNIAAAERSAAPQNLPAPSVKAKVSDIENNSMVLPNVEALSKTDAASVLKNVQYIIDQGQDVGRIVSGVNGNDKTDSLDVYKSWLHARIGIDVYA